MRERFVRDLATAGVDEPEAVRRYNRMEVLRRASPEREQVYWNGAFKSGGGPDAPLQLLQETVRSMKAGRALDAGMGRGRNTIFLATLGWDVTGYDLSPDALKAAQAAADVAKVKIQTKEARHDTFEFGESQWDLLVCAYCYMRLDEEQWPAVFLKALKPGGVVVFQTSTNKRVTAAEQAARWRGFRLLRVADLDAGMVDNDWTPSKSYPTGMLVARKE
jgi:SAM-dependent methyltransferase